MMGMFHFLYLSTEETLGTPEVVTLSFFAEERRDPMSKIVVVFEGKSSSVDTNSQKGF